MILILLAPAEVSIYGIFPDQTNIVPWCPDREQPIQIHAYACRDGHQFALPEKASICPTLGIILTMLKRKYVHTFRGEYPQIE